MSSAVMATDFFRYPLSHTGLYPEQSVSDSPQLQGKYGLLNHGIHSASKSSPIVDKGTIYVGSDAGTLFALDASSMSPIWTFQVRKSAKQGIHATPAIDDQHVYVGDYAGWLYAVDREDGHLVWQRQLGGSIGSSPVLWQGRLYIGVETREPDGYLACVDAGTGEVLFESERFGDQTHATPAINTKSATVFIGANNKSFYAIDANNGKTRWVFETDGDIKSTAALHDGRVYVSSWDGNLYALEQDSGSVVWKFRATRKSMSSPSIDADAKLVYFASHDQHIYAVHLDSGKLAWKFATDGWIISSPTLVSRQRGKGRLLLIGSYDNYLYGLDAAAGKLVFKLKTDGKITSVATVKDDTIYVSGDDGWLYAWR